MARNIHLIEYSHRGQFDEVYTPQMVADDFADFIIDEYRSHGMNLSNVWECTDPGTSTITSALSRRGVRVISTHISNGYDFLTFEPDFDFDIIITNPPYSKKDQFIERCVWFKTPFALLLPITALAGKRRCGLYEKLNGISVRIYANRIDFTGGRNNWFNVCWIYWLPFARPKITFSFIDNRR